jgi:hypothetical protein
MGSSTNTPKQHAPRAQFSLPVQLDLREPNGKPIPAQIERVSTGFFQLSSPVHLQSDTKLDVLLDQQALEVEVIYCKANQPGVYAAGVRLTPGLHSGVRREPRIPLDFPAEISVPNTDKPILGKVVNMSRSGLGLRTASAVHVGTGLSVHIPTGIAFGVVRHCTKRSGGAFQIGISLEEFISKEDARKSTASGGRARSPNEQKLGGLVNRILKKQ